MPFELPNLPYDKSALEPHISAETLEYHYGKHHQSYVTNLNKLVQDTEHEGLSLRDLILSASGPIFNNAAQVWNHTFYWNCLSPNGGGEPKGELLEQINKVFGSFADFKSKFSDVAVKTFGSGWAWLVKNESGDLEIRSTSNAKNPMTDGCKPLLTCDVWEHAYYIDYRNRRPEYLDKFVDNLVNWEFVESLLD